MTFALVNNVLDALEILVLVQRADAELRHAASVRNRLKDPAPCRQQGHWRGQSSVVKRITKS